MPLHQVAVSENRDAGKMVVKMDFVMITLDFSVGKARFGVP